MARQRAGEHVGPRSRGDSQRGPRLRPCHRVGVQSAQRRRVDVVLHDAFRVVEHERERPARRYVDGHGRELELVRRDAHLWEAVLCGRCMKRVRADWPVRGWRGCGRMP